MERTIGKNVKVSKDSTGAFISVDWVCPVCGEYNSGFYFTSNIDEVTTHFEVDHECDHCQEMVAIEYKARFKSLAFFMEVTMNKK